MTIDVHFFFVPFQFTLPHGERQVLPGDSFKCDVFQFTLPHGERRVWLPRRRLTRCFNSRSRMGSDTIHRARFSAVGLFQFTLPHGERLRKNENVPLSSKFQFTLPHGERPEGRVPRPSI